MRTLSNVPLRDVGNKMDSQYKKDLKPCQASRHSTNIGYFHWKSQGVRGMASSLSEDPSLKSYLFSGHPPSTVDCHRPTCVAGRHFSLTPRPRLPPQGPCPSLLSIHQGQCRPGSQVLFNLKPGLEENDCLSNKPTGVIDNDPEPRCLPWAPSPGGQVNELATIDYRQGSDSSLPHTARRQCLAHRLLDLPPLTALLSTISHICQNLRFPKGPKHVNCTFWACLRSVSGINIFPVSQTLQPGVPFSRDLRLPWTAGTWEPTAGRNGAPKTLFWTKSWWWALLAPPLIFVAHQVNISTHFCWCRGVTSSTQIFTASNWWKGTWTHL